MPPSVSSTFRITAVGPEDRRWISTQLRERWGAEFVVARGVCYTILELDGFVAWTGDEPAGLLTYVIEGNACEIVTIDSFVERKGIGTALLDAVANMAGSTGCRRLTLITTNDNLNALRFYQKRGFRLIALHPKALDTSRNLKPQIPLIGNHGIPLRDELELERTL